MKTVSKSALKTKMLEYFREIEKTGEELVVTDHNRPVLKIVPIKPKARISEIFGDYEGKVRYAEDIRTPTLDEWSES
jgi:prevent-host-death family protein